LWPSTDRWNNRRPSRNQPGAFLRRDRRQAASGAAGPSAESPCRRSRATVWGSGNESRWQAWLVSAMRAVQPWARHPLRTGPAWGEGKPSVPTNRSDEPLLTASCLSQANAPNWGDEPQRPWGWLIARVLAVEPLAEPDLFSAARRMKMIRTAERTGNSLAGPPRTRCSARPNPCWSRSTKRRGPAPRLLPGPLPRLYADGKPCWAPPVKGRARPPPRAAAGLERGTLSAEAAQARLRDAIFAAIEPKPHGSRCARPLDVGCFRLASGTLGPHGLADTRVGSFRGRQAPRLSPQMLAVARGARMQGGRSEACTTPREAKRTA